MLNAYGLGFMFSAVDHATPVIRRLEHSFLGATSRMKERASVFQAAAMGLVGSLALIGAGALGLRTSMQLAMGAGQFEMAIARVGAVSQASSADMKLLRDAAVDLGLRGRFAPTQIADGMGILAAAGFTAHESIQAVSDVLNLATGGSISLETAAAAMTASLKTFNITADRSGYVADRLLAISNLTSLSANELALAMGNVGRGAGLTNQSFEEMLISIGMVRNTGQEASASAHAVSSALMDMASKGKEFKKLGISLVDATGRFRGFREIAWQTYQVLKDRIPDATERVNKAEELFGRYGVSAYKAVFTQAEAGIRVNGQLLRGTEMLNYQTQQLANSTGTAAEFVARLQNTFLGQIEKLTASFKTLGDVVGESFGKAIRPEVTRTTELLARFVRWWESLSDTTKVSLARFAIGLSTAAVAVGSFFASFYLAAMAIEVLGTIGTTLTLIGYAVAGGVAAAAVFGTAWSIASQAIRENLGGAADTFWFLVSSIQLGYKALVQLFSSGKLTEGLALELANPRNNFLRRFVTDLYAIWGRLQAFFEGIKTGFQAFFRTVAGEASINGLISAFRDLWNALRPLSDIMMGLTDSTAEWRVSGDNLGETFGRISAWIMDAIAAVARIFQGFIEAIVVNWDTIVGMWDTLKIVFMNFWDIFSRHTQYMGSLVGTTDQANNSAKRFGAGLGVTLIGALRVVVLGLQFLLGALSMVWLAFNFIIDVVQSAIHFFTQLFNLWKWVYDSPFGKVFMFGGHWLEGALLPGLRAPEEEGVRGTGHPLAAQPREAARGLPHNFFDASGIAPLVAATPARGLSPLEQLNATARGNISPAALRWSSGADAESLIRSLNNNTEAVRNSNNQPIQILMGDGAILAAAHRGERDAATSAFRPVTEGE